MSERVTINEHLCLTEDRSRVVPETDPAARWLHWIPGQQVPRAEALRLGAIQPDPDPDPEPEPEPDPEPEPEAPKRRAPRANKARKPAGDKGDDADGGAAGRW